MFVYQIMNVGRIKRDAIIDIIIPKRGFEMHSESEARKKSDTDIGSVPDLLSCD